MIEGSSGAPADEQLLTVQVRRVGDAVVVSASGEIDIMTVQRFRDGLDGGVEQAGPGPLVVDLTRVTFLGSVGLAALIEVRSSARREQLPLRVVVDHARPVIRPIQIADLDEVLALYETVEQALGG